MCGGEPGETSNNRMELTAPIMALEALTRPVTVHLYTDSTYVRNGITKWVLGWERNGWKTAAKQPVKNVDLWKRLQTGVRAAPRRVVLGEGALGGRRQRVGRRAGDAGPAGSLRYCSLTTSPGSLSGRSPRQLG